MAHFHPWHSRNPPPEWISDAACKGRDTNLFFPDGPAQHQLFSGKARKVCDKCPVSLSCLWYALTEPERIGMWGGLTAKERSKLGRYLGTPNKRATLKVKCGTVKGYRRHVCHSEEPCGKCTSAMKRSEKRRAAKRSADEAAKTAYM